MFGACLGQWLHWLTVTDTVITNTVYTVTTTICTWSVPVIMHSLLYKMMPTQLNTSACEDRTMCGYILHIPIPSRWMGMFTPDIATPRGVCILSIFNSCHAKSYIHTHTHTHSLICKLANYIFINCKTSYLSAQWSTFDDHHINIIRGAPGLYLYE